MPAGRPRQQQQQQQDLSEDLYTNLSLVLACLDEAGQQSCARALSCVSEGGRSSSITTIKRLDLSHYELGRMRALHLLGMTAAAAIIRAATVPIIPWNLLADVAAAGALTSLRLGAYHAAHLLGGPSSNPPSPPTAPTWLPGALGNLRQLTVEHFQEPGQVSTVGRLVGCCSGLTELHLVLAGLPPADNDTDTSMGDPAAPAAAPAPAAAGAPAAAASRVPAAPGCALRDLRHLTVTGGPSWAVNQLVGAVGTAALTTLCLEYAATSSMDMSLLAACSGLQQLRLMGVSAARYGPSPAQALAQQLRHLKALTQLVVIGAEDAPRLQGSVPDAVWALTQLRHLDMINCWGMETLPEAISSLRQLTLLGVAGAGLAELPEQLGAWMPQLRHLDVSCTGGDFSREHHLAAIPLGLSQLTHLDVSDCSIRSVSALKHLVQLKVLNLSGDQLRSRFKKLSKLTALEHLDLTLIDAECAGNAVAIPSPLPRLHSLMLCSDHPAAPLRQLLGGGQCLTRLVLIGIGRDSGKALRKLGRLPALQQLVLLDTHLRLKYGALCTWLQQQEQLTSLTLHMGGFPSDRRRQAGPQLPALPPHLERLVLIEWPGWPLPECLRQCTTLRVLEVRRGRAPHQGWPEWLTGLTALEEVRWSQAPPPDGMQHLAQLPRLRGIWAEADSDGEDVFPEDAYNRANIGVPAREQLLTAAPHLCWAK